MVKSTLALVLFFFSAFSMALDVGDKAPQIVGRSIEGGLFALTRMEAKPKVINFFWVDCKPCKEEIPLLAAKEAKYPNVAFAVVHAEKNAASDANYDVEDIQAFAKTLSAHPKNLVLGSDRLKQQYGIESFPISFLLSADNKVEQVLIGFNQKTVDQLVGWLDQQN